MLPRIVPRSLLFVYTLFLLTLTLLILGGRHPTLNLVPFRSMARDWRYGGVPLLVNFWGNIVAFLPLGLLFPLVRVGPSRAWHAVLFTGLLSLAIETMQFAYANRNADVDDVILNALGGWLGFALLRLWQGYASSDLTRELASSSSKMG